MKEFTSLPYLLFAMLLSLMFISTSDASAAATTSNKDQVYSEDNLNVMVTPSKPQFTIKLKSNPTTGYSWFLREYNKDYIKPLKHRFEASKDKLIGAPGFDYWTFQAKEAMFTVPQQTIIRLIYARPWKATDGSTPIVVRVTSQSS